MAAAQPALKPAPIAVEIDAASLQTQLDALREKHKVPALTALLMDSSGVRWHGVTGKRSQIAEERATLGDRWHLGSCTKAMTAVLAARLIDAGQPKLAWTTTVGEVFPELKPAMKPGWERVTLTQLFSHTAGIAVEPVEAPIWLELRNGDEAGESTRVQRRKSIEWAVTQDLGSTPGTAMVYSNLGYMIAGHMLETLADRSWEDLMHEHVFALLGITTAGFGPPGSREDVDQPRGHAGGQGVWMPLVPGLHADNPRSLGPAGTVHMSMPDWGRFVWAGVFGERAGSGVELGDEPGGERGVEYGGRGEMKPGPQFLSDEAIRMIRTPVIGTREQGQPAGDGYSMGWIVTNRPWAKGSGEKDRGLVLSHGGSNTIWVVTAWVAPERGLVLLAACNAHSAESERAIDEAIGIMVMAAAGKAPANQPLAQPAAEP
jgi:D-alanyl-D-alanine carboxypeptidase